MRQTTPISESQTQQAYLLANKWLGEKWLVGYDREDLIQEVVTAVARGIKYFDEKKGKFTTFVYQVFKSQYARTCKPVFALKRRAKGVSSLLITAPSTTLYRDENGERKTATVYQNKTPLDALIDGKMDKTKQLIVHMVKTNPKYTILKEYFLGGIGFKGLGKKYGVSQQAVSSRKKTLIKSLILELERLGIDIKEYFHTVEVQEAEEAPKIKTIRCKKASNN